jgi:hypothetical protein
VVTLYAGPEAGDLTSADHADSMFGFPCGHGRRLRLLDGAAERRRARRRAPRTSAPTCRRPPPAPTSPQTSRRSSGLRGVWPVTVRFDDGAIELETAVDAVIGTPSCSGGGTADVVESLPADTGPSYGVGFADGWFGDVIDYVAPYTGSDADELMSELSDMTGLDLPADAETLAGDSAALALGSDFDPERSSSSEDGSDIPIALKIRATPTRSRRCSTSCATWPARTPTCSSPTPTATRS